MVYVHVIINLLNSQIIVIYHVHFFMIIIQSIYFVVRISLILINNTIIIYETSNNQMNYIYSVS